MIKILSKIHIYLSIPVGIIISIICLTGAGMVLDKEIHTLFNPSLYKVEQVGEATLPMDKLVDKLLTQLPEMDTIVSVSISPQKDMAYQFSLKNANSTFFVNQYTGELQGDYYRYEKTGFYRTMFHLHRWLMNRESWGKTTVGVSTLIFVLIIISGFFIWLPRGIYSLKKGLSINTKRGWKRFWYDLHVAGGIHIGGWILILALTGLMWSFPSWYRPMVYSIFGVESPAPRAKGNKGSNNREMPVIKYQLWDSVLKDIQSREKSIVSINIRSDKAYVYNKKYGNVRSYNTYNFNKDSGVIEKIDLYSSRAESSRFMGWMYSIHVGSWGGLTTKIITFIVSLVGGILPITGYYFWIKKKVRKRKNRLKKSNKEKGN